MNIIAKAISESDSKTQAEFLNEFARMLKLCCGTRYETQIHYIADDLDSNGREFVGVLHESAKVAVETRATKESEIQDLYRQKRELEQEIQELRSAQLLGKGEE